MKPVSQQRELYDQGTRHIGGNMTREEHLEALAALDQEEVAAREAAPAEEAQVEAVLANFQRQTGVMPLLAGIRSIFVQCVTLQGVMTPEEKRWAKDQLMLAAAAMKEG